MLPGHLPVRACSRASSPGSEAVLSLVEPRHHRGPSGVAGGVFFQGAWAAIRTSSSPPRRADHLGRSSQFDTWSIYTTIRGSGEICLRLAERAGVRAARAVRPAASASDTPRTRWSCLCHHPAWQRGWWTATRRREVTVESLVRRRRRRGACGRVVSCRTDVVLGSSSVDRSLLTGESRPAQWIAVAAMLAACGQSQHAIAHASPRRANRPRGGLRCGWSRVLATAGPDHPDGRQALGLLRRRHARRAS